MNAFLRLILLPLLPLNLSAETLVNVLHRYQGRWSGEFTVHSTASGFTESFPVEQRYWMVGERLRGIAVAQRDGGVETTSSWTYVDGKKLISEVTRGEKVEVYYGVVKAGVVLWVSSDLNRVEDYQLTERIVESNGNRKLLTEGFDTYIYAEGLARVIYRGELILERPVEAEGQ